MATTKFDLLRDVLKDALLDFDFRVYDEDDRVGMLLEDTIDDIVDSMLDVLTDNNVDDENADKRDFTIKVVMDKKIDTATEYGEVTPTVATKESEVL